MIIKHSMCRQTSCDLLNAPLCITLSQTHLDSFLILYLQLLSTKRLHHGGHLEVMILEAFKKEAL